MRITPTTRRGWFALLLLPFQVYVVAMPLWFKVWEVMTREIRFRYMVAEEVHKMLPIYGACLWVFIIAWIIQIGAGWKRGAVVSAISAGVTFLILAFYLQPMNWKG